MAYTTIPKSSDYFNTKLYSGSNGTQSVSGVGFQPDWSWLKCRSSAYNHRLFDAVRGVTKNLQSNATNAEQTIDEGITAFNSDGFSVKQGANLEYNASGQTYASWNWKANGSGSANTDGSISSTVSVNTTSGFSIVSYTGDGTNNNTATIGHGLGVAPSMIIVKGINATASWITTNTINGWNNVLELNSTAANAASTYAFGSTGIPPTSTVFTVAAASGQHHTNTNGGTYIAYCFAEKQGFSKFSSYTGNGSTDGTFVYTGFKPAFVMVKRTDATGNWVMVDSKRDTFNVCDAVVSADTSDAEYDVDVEDFLSNGFKMRDAHTTRNASGGTYIYMAIAEEPLVGDNPATAR
jgi:hypothetical protein